MQIAVERLTGSAVVRVTGDLDVTTVPDLRLELNALLDGTTDVTVDLSGVSFLDATGLGVLVGAHRRAGRHGVAFELRDPPHRIRRLLAVTRLDRVLRITSSLLDPVA